jgi:tripartite-type tricarboxylate transporter receptor subunit TctC
MIVPFAAGGPTDAGGRLLAQGMAASLGQAIVVENIGAADGTIGVGRVAHARPDGYTIDYGALTTHVLPGAIYQLQYDLLNDFAPVIPTTTSPYLLYARTTVPAKDLRELIALLKTERDTRSVGVGSAGYRLVTALLQKETGARLTVVPYRGLGLGLIRHVEHDLDLPVAAPGAFEAPRELLQRRCLSPRPDQGLHLKLSAGLAVDRQAVVAALGRRPGDEAADADAPAELPGFAEGVDFH